MQEHLTHYKKVKITKDISLRYFYTYQDRKHFENKWVLKSHKTKTSSIVDKYMIELLSMLHSFDINNYKEIRGMVKDGNYEKVIIKSNGKIKRIVEKQQTKEEN
ncbi:MAG: hypothetical protein DRG78_18760 [Epsilonproteobacteria bacterium]|nr:MAG: hypothetical protein DRG78_18760 [Campylobacterota bacterium]